MKPWKIVGFGRESEPGGGSISLEDILEGEILPQGEPGGEGPILCGHCRRYITLRTHRIEVNGSVTHVVKNPAGISFTIGCFSRAEGCVELDAPTLDFTWFPEYAWQISVCGQCDFHLGWYYTCGDGSFYGLILERLIFSS